jgi:hypothetical protein
VGEEVSVWKRARLRIQVPGACGSGFAFAIVSSRPCIFPSSLYPCPLRLSRIAFPGTARLCAKGFPFLRPVMHSSGSLGAPLALVRNDV